MQSERTPVLRYNVAAFVLCILSMVAFGRWTLEHRAERDRAEHARAEQRLQQLVDNQNLAIERVRHLLDHETSPGCTLGLGRVRPHVSELQRQRDKIKAMREAREAMRARVDAMRCREAHCTTFSPSY